MNTVQQLNSHIFTNKGGINASVRSCSSGDWQLESISSRLAVSMINASLQPVSTPR